MSAQQITTRPSDAATESSSYGLADLRADMAADRGVAVAVRAAVGLLVAVAGAILVAGVATQSAFAIIAGSISTALLAGVLVWFARVPAEPNGR